MTAPTAAPPEKDPAVTGLKMAKVLVWLIYAYFAAAMLLLVLTFFLQLFNASTDAAFTEWVYRSASRVLQPFRGIFPTQDIGTQGSVVDFAVLFAIVLYGILAIAIHTFVDWLDRKAVEHQRAAAAARHQELVAAQAGHDREVRDQVIREQALREQAQREEAARDQAVRDEALGGQRPPTDPPTA